MLKTLYIPVLLLFIAFSAKSQSLKKIKKQYKGTPEKHVDKSEIVDEINQKLKDSDVSTMNFDRLQTLKLQEDSITNQYDRQLKDTVNSIGLIPPNQLSKSDIQPTVEKVIEENFNTEEYKGFNYLNQKFDSLITLKRISSERQIRNYLDSIGLNNFSYSDLKTGLSEEELVKKINDKFGSTESTPDHSAFNDLDLSKFELQPDLASQLPLFEAFQIPSEFSQKLDSLKEANLKEKRIVLEERPVSNDETLVHLKEKQKVWDQLYFEGIIGLSKFKDQVWQLTPSLGLNLIKNFSIGAGPIFQFYNHAESKKSTLGLRQFIKQELFFRKGYLQVEHILNPKIKQLEDIKIRKSSVLVGGGFIIPTSEKMAMNLSLLYDLNNFRSELANSIPLVFRLGISSFTNSKK